MWKSLFAPLGYLLLCASAQGQIVWTGQVSDDVFEESNWDLSGSPVTAVDPNVSIGDDVLIANTQVAARIPSLPNQQRFQLGDGRVLSLVNASLDSADDDGIGGANGTSNGPTIEVTQGGSLGVWFIVNGVHLDLDSTSSARFGGGGNPVNQSTIDLTLGALLEFANETPAAFLSEHLGKITVDDAPALVGTNLAVVSDGANGCVVSVISVGPLDSDQDLLPDDEEINQYFTNPLVADTDRDGTPDGLEVARNLDPNDPTSRMDRPNVIFILCDDLGYGDLGVLFQNNVPGTKRQFTPQLDFMAAKGLILDKHYCPAAVCAPSRASLLAGVHQGHANIRDNQFDKALEDNHNLANTLGKTGYATALIGKWGLQGSGSNPTGWPAYPTKRGFDYFFGYVRHADGHTHYPAHATAARPTKQLWEQDTEISGQLSHCYTADLFTARAKSYITEQAQRHPAKPFFLMLAFDTPHAALHRPTQAYPAGGGLAGGLQWIGTPGNMINTASGVIDSYVHPDYASLGWSDSEERFATANRRLDSAVGDILQTLRDLGIEKDTLIVFTSDNGPHNEAYTPGLSYGSNRFDSFGPFDGTKRDAWEGGVRMPTLVYWPGVIRPGRIDHEASQFHDWLATFTDLAGWTTPARSDGVSLVPSLSGSETRADSTIYVEYASNSSTPGYAEFGPSHRGRLRGQEQVVHLEGYKGVRVAIQNHASPFEIYDLDADPKESNNLAISSPFFVGLQQRMRDRVLRIRRPNGSAARPYDNEFVPAVQEAVLPGLEVRSYEGLWPWIPEFTRLDAVATGTAAMLDLQSLTRSDNAGLLFTGFLDVPSGGDWTFRSASDAGTLLRIHDATVIDDDYMHSSVPATGTIRLQAGLHPFRLYYRTRHAVPQLNLTWSGPGISEQPVPASALNRADRRIGSSYCPGNVSSTGVPGLLQAEGNPEASANDLRLIASDLPPGQIGFFLTSKTQGFLFPAGSSGILCLGNQILRMTNYLAVGPAVDVAIDLTGSPFAPANLIQPGETWNFQFWHRDFAGGMPTSNLTGGLAIPFQ